MGVWVGAGGGYRRFLSILSRAFHYSIYPVCVSYCVIVREKYISIWTFFLTRIHNTGKGLYDASLGRRRFAHIIRTL